jgi:hypothetical protein
MKRTLREMAAHRVRLDGRVLTEDELIQALREIALSPVSRPADRLRALDLLGRQMESLGHRIEEDVAGLTDEERVARAHALVERALARRGAAAS